MLSSPSVANNGMLRCYNMFPSHFKNIQEMTDYLDHVNKLGMNAVWINPVQLTGSFAIQKADMLTASQQELKGSLYAMSDPNLIDPRFSMVKRDEDGDVLLTKQQIARLPNYKKSVLSKAKQYRKEIRLLNQDILSITKNLNQLHTANKNGKNDKGISTVQSKIKKLEKTLATTVKHLNRKIAIQNSWLMLIDGEAMQAFTARAKELEMTPIFDLVFNHLASDAPFATDPRNAALFNLDDKTYPDATAFSYSKLLGSKRGPVLSEAARLETLAQIPTIIEQFWQPFIHQYVNEWGFCGARIDCVKKVPQELRLAVYQLIRDGVAMQENPAPVVILEEALFSELSTEEFVQKVKSANATHITGSTYYAEREWHGGLKGDYNKEDYLKKTMVSDGVVNFTGNHDHFTCAMTVCRQLAFERLQKNPQLFEAYSAFIYEKEKEREKEKPNEGPLPAASVELIKTLFIHPYVKSILDELNNPDEFNETINRFGKDFRDKIITNVYAGSGGYFLLSGDEYASFYQPTVFTRANSERVYPDTKLGIFESPLKQLAFEVIEKMARDSVNGKKYKKILEQLSPENQRLFLSSFIEQIYFEINSHVDKTQDRFIRSLKALAKDKNITLDQSIYEEVDDPQEYKNRWRAPVTLKKFANPDFFQEINYIMDQLPRSEKGFWSSLFKSNNDNILIAVRVNGEGYNAHTDVIVHNLNPDKPVRFDKQDLEKIGMWLQKRGFPNGNDGTTAYHEAYGCIMGAANKQAPADLYFAGKIEVDKDIEDHVVYVDGQQKGFNIVVRPPKIAFDPLLGQGPQEFVPETYSHEQLLTMFKMTTINSPKKSLSSSASSSSPSHIWLSSTAATTAITTTADWFNDDDDEYDDVSSSCSSCSFSSSTSGSESDDEELLFGNQFKFKGF